MLNPYPAVIYYRVFVLHDSLGCFACGAVVIPKRGPDL